MKRILSNSYKYSSYFFLKSVLVVCLVLSLFTTASAQTSPFIHENGVRKAKFLTVNFKERVLDLQRGVKTAAVSQVGASYANLKMFLSQLENRYGKITMRKQIPDAVWGDVWRTHRRTGKPVRVHEWSQLFYLIFPYYVPVDSIVSELRLRPEVDYSHAPVIPVPDVEPDDPHYDGTLGTQWNLDIIQAEKAWDVTKGSSDVIVAIVEVKNTGQSGIPNKDHYDLSGKFAPGGHNLEQGETPGDHATNVAGIVGAATNNNTDIASLGWNIRMRPYRFDETHPDIGEDDQALAAAIYDALNEGCDVMNCSFGLITEITKNPCGICVVKQFAKSADIPETEEMLDDAVAMGVVIVGSAGNHYSGWTGGDCSSCMYAVFQPRLPAAYLNAIAVTTTDSNDDPIPGYNQGEFISVASPGVIVKTTSGDTLSMRSGTSFSAPLVAALAGLIKSINPDITPSQVKTIIKQTAYDTGDDMTLVGAGRINAYEALKYTLENYGGTLTGEVVFAEDLNVTNGVTITIEPGATVKLAPGVDLWFRDDSRLVAVGSASEPITFTSTESNPEASEYGTIYLFGNNNQLEYCTVEYSDWGVKIHGTPNYTTGNVLRNCTFRFNDQGLRFHNSTVTVEDVTLEDNRHAFVILDNADVTIRDNLVQHNDRDGIYSAGSVIDIFDSRFEYNGEGDLYTIHGIYAAYGDDVSLGSRDIHPDPDEVGGFNTMRYNRGAGILVTYGAVVHAGEFIVPLQEYTRGKNSFHDNGAKSGTYNGVDFYNSASTTMLAQNNYWGGNCPPLSSQTSGAVDVSYCLGGSPTGLMAFGPDWATPQPYASLNEKNPLDDTQIKKNFIAGYKQTIAAQPNSQTAVDALQKLYNLVRTDRQNKLGERATIYSYLNGVYTANQSIELARTALQLMILESRRVENLATAISLSEDALAKLTAEAKAGVLFNLVFIVLQTGDLEKAGQLVEDFRSEFPKNVAEIEMLEGTLKQARGNKEANFAKVILKQVTL